MTKTESAYFRHCDKPTLSPINGNVKGNIPEWLTGTLIRDGAGIQRVGPDVYNHFFDGLAVLHRIHIENGKATYSNRPLESETYRMNMEAQRIILSAFGTRTYTDPCDTIFAKFKAEFKQAGTRTRDNCSVNVCYYGDQLYAMQESATVRRFDPETLKSIGDGTLISDFVPVDSATAHPHVLEDGTCINVWQHFTHQKGPHYAFFAVPPSFNSSETSFTKAKIVAEIPAQNPAAPSYFHSFGITKDKIIFIEQPLCINLLKIKESGKLLNEDIVARECMDWDPEAKTRFHVASIATGEIHPIVYETSQLFTFHHINAYEEDGHLIVDVAGYDTGKYVIDDLLVGTIDKISNSGGSGRRYILPLDITNRKDGNLISLKNTTATAHLRQGSNAIVDLTPHIFYNKFFEFGRINYKLNGKPYRYVYGVTTSKPMDKIPAFPETNTIVKVDLESNHTLSWHEENAMTAEPIFVANPTAENGAEDDGVILCPLLYSDDLMKMTLLILDAREFKEIARVDFNAIGTIPGTFHGQWANTADKTHFY